MGEPSATNGAASSSKILLVIIDDNRLIRDSLSLLIRQQPDFEVLATSANLDEAMRAVRETKPHVVLVDFGLGNNDSLLLTRSVCGDATGARVIIMGIVPDQEDIAEFVRAGASGFVMKDSSIELFMQAICAVFVGLKVLPDVLTAPLFGQIAAPATRKYQAASLDPVRLTPRERQVVDLIGDGLSNKEIAARLHIAVHTVKSHVHKVLEKFALHSRLEVAAFTRPSGR